MYIKILNLWKLYSKNSIISSSQSHIHTVFDFFVHLHLKPAASTMDPLSVNKSEYYSAHI